ncbi:MAG: DUF6429 family protein [Marivita sp.]|uniref:DUF6429 family protein n=1 Tax=Marivita sp. TaxID=2003365 RepID=UPI003EF957A0
MMRGHGSKSGQTQENEEEMALDIDKIDDAALAILSLTLHYGDQVWKGVDWAITDLLHNKGLIEDPRRKTKSLTLMPEGIERAQAVLAREFTKVE